MKSKKEYEAELARKLSQTYPHDERVSRISEQGLAACGIIAIFYVFIRIVYVGFRGELAAPELILLAVMLIAIAIVNYKNKSYTLPVVFRKPLDPAPSSRKKRMLLYALNALPLTVSLTIIDIYARINEKNIDIMQFIADFIIAFIIVYLFDFTLNEVKIKRYNNHMRMLESEENDLSD